MAFSIQSSLIEARDAAPVAYYRFTEARLACLTEALEAPSNYLNSLADRAFLVKVVAVFVLGLPALRGQALSCAIYYVKGERIRIADYRAAFNDWLGIELHLSCHPHLQKRFIDFCIQYRISPAACHHNIVITRPIDGRPLYIFTMDGVAGGCYDRLDTLHPLIICFADESWRIGQYETEIHREVGGESSPLTTQDMRRYYKEVYKTDPIVAKGVIDRCRFIWFSWGTTLTRANAEYVRQMLTSD